MFSSPVLRTGGLSFAQISKSTNYVINSTFRKIFSTRLQETVGVCLEMFIVSKLNRQLRYINVSFKTDLVLQVTYCVRY